MLSHPRALCGGGPEPGRRAFSHGFRLLPRAAIEKHARFRHMCTGFFVDLVSTVCFKDNRPPDKDVVEMLLSLLFAEKNPLRGAPQSTLRLPVGRKLQSPLASVCLLGTAGPPFSFWFQGAANTQNLCPRSTTSWTRRPSSAPWS